MITLTGVTKSFGARQVLAVVAANRDLGSITAPELQQWLLPLRGKPTLVVLSASS